MELFLVRHGEAASSWGESADPGLSELGRQEAEAAAGQLMRYVDPDVLLISSPLQRALETAQPLAKLLDQPVCEEDVFREIPSPVPLAQRQGWLRQFMQQDWHEQSKELMAWRTATLSRLLELRQPAVVFTHFLVINAVVGQVLERSETLHCWPANGSITRLRLRGDHLELITLGEQIESVVN